MVERKRPVLIKKGAEADLYLHEWHGRKSILKVRIAKCYRAKQLDLQIRRNRTMTEPLLMHEARMAGVRTPIIFHVDVGAFTIVMEFMKGRQARQVLEEASDRDKETLCHDCGRLIGRLHHSGLIHGDLTTSNVIVSPDRAISFLDFGLGQKSDELEDMGVDLHLLKRTFQTTHFRSADLCFQSVLNGYGEVVGNEFVEKIMNKIREVERRGRYIAERKESR